MGKHSKPVGDLLIGDAAATYGSPMRDKDDGTYRGGRREDTCDHGLWLVQEVAEGKELLLVMVELEIKEKCCSKKYICQLPLRPSIPIVVFDLNNGILTKEHTDLFGSYLTYCKDDKNDSDFTVMLRSAKTSTTTKKRTSVGGFRRFWYAVGTADMGTARCIIGALKIPEEVDFKWTSVFCRLLPLPTT